MKNATSSGRSTRSDRRLAHQDRDAGFQLGRLDRDRQAPAEARFQPLLQAVDFLRIAIAGQDDLLLAFEQRVERVEELFLRAILAGEELDVVDQQRIERAIRGLEIVDRVVLKRLHHVADEALRVHVRDARALVAAADHVADGVHQVRLAQTDAAVDEQRVVGAPGILGDLHGRGARELIALALDEVREREVRIQPAAEQRRQVLGLRPSILGARASGPARRLARRASRLRARPTAPARSRPHRPARKSGRRRSRSPNRRRSGSGRAGARCGRLRPPAAAGSRC